MIRDTLDEIVNAWQTVYPNVDARPLEVVGRILRLAGRLERRANEVLKPLDLPIWAFDVLGALRRHGSPFSMTPKQLLASVMLTSGAMTNRIDRLERMGLVKRTPASNDRRSLHVCLTTAGRKAIDAAVKLRFGEAEDAVHSLSVRERKQLAALLRKLLMAVESNGSGVSSPENLKAKE